MTSDVLVRQATIDDLDALASLFDAYRQFYKQPPDLALARTFLWERFQHSQSIVFIAVDQVGRALGFTQLYPSFSSALARRIFILNDLFVGPEARRSGIGRILLEAAADFGRKAGAARLTLMTAVDNAPAQALYERLGWERDQAFWSYRLPL